MKLKPLSLIITGLFINTVNAEVILDGFDNIASNNVEIEATNGSYSITEVEGQLKGSNLFHSFDKFNIDTNETAAFSGPDSVQNIISRVTGGESTINGTISSDIPSANLWLINPEGILFGDNAALNIQGSFHASTADYIKLRDGVKYNAVTEVPILTSSPPQTFGFLDPISSTANIDAGNARLTVPENQSVTLLGSDVSLQGTLISAPGGNISVVSINEAGEVIYSDQGLDTSTTEEFGHLSIDSTSFKINGEQKGSIQIKGGDLEINSSDTDFVSSVTNLKASFFEDTDLMEKPCELADFYNQGKMSFIVNQDEDETEYGVKTKKNRRGPIGGAEAAECL